VEDRAPTKARNSRKALRILEKNNSWIDNQEEWVESGKEEEDLGTESDSSSIVALIGGMRRMFTCRNPQISTLSFSQAIIA